jgi:hypothetical protein
MDSCFVEYIYDTESGRVFGPVKASSTFCHPIYVTIFFTLFFAVLYTARTDVLCNDRQIIVTHVGRMYLVACWFTFFFFGRDNAYAAWFVYICMFGYLSTMLSLQ